MKEVVRANQALILNIIVAGVAIALAGTYAFFAILGFVPMNPWIFLLLLYLLVLLHLPLFARMFAARHELSIRARIILALWAGLLLWYWILAPVYLLLTVNLDSLQLKWAAFEFIWGAPLIGAAFIAVSLLLFRPIQRFAEGRTLEIPSADLHSRVRTYPLIVGLLIILFMIIGYGAGTLQLALFAHLPPMEQLKTFLNGPVLSLFLAVVYTLLLGPILGGVRKSIEETASPQKQARFTIRGKALVASFFILVGSFLLIDLVALKAFHQTIENSVRGRMEQMLQRDGTAGAAFGKRGEVLVLPRDADRVRSLVSQETFQDIQQEQRGVLNDSRKDSKLLAFSGDRASGETLVSVAYLTDFYSQLVIPLTSFVVAEFFIFALLFGMAGFTAKTLSSTLQRLTATAKRAAEGRRVAIPAITTGDEVEDLAKAFRYFVERTWEFERQLEGKAENYSRQLTETTKQKEELLDSNIVLEEQNRVLEEARIKEEALIESIGAGIVVTDRDGRVVRVNQAFEQLLGWEEHELYGKFLVQVIPMEDETNGRLIRPEDRPIRKVLDTMGRGVGRYTYIAKDGGRTPVEITISPFLFRGKLFGTVEVVKDLSQEQEIDRVKRDFVSIASHQLRTPLTTISWYSEVLRARTGEYSEEKRREYIEHIYRADQRMIRLVNALLNVTRLEAGTFPIHPEPVYLRQALQEIKDALGNKISLKNLRIEESYEEGLPQIAADSTAVMLIFENLISNAIKYTKPGGTIRVSLLFGGEDHVLVMIADSGMGIPKEQQMQIFTKFFRGDNAGQEGTGLGLFIVKSLVDLLNGRIWFTSIEGKGTTFYCELPIHHSAPSGRRASVSVADKKKM